MLLEGSDAAQNGIKRGEMSAFVPLPHGIVLVANRAKAAIGVSCCSVAVRGRGAVMLGFQSMIGRPVPANKQLDCVVVLGHVNHMESQAL